MRFKGFFVPDNRMGQFCAKCWDERVKYELIEGKAKPYTNLHDTPSFLSDKELEDWKKAQEVIRIHNCEAWEKTSN